MTREPRAAQGRAPLELWVRASFALGIVGALVFLLLGFESPARWHRWLYVAGLPLVALTGAALLAFGLFASVRRRPFLQPGRLGAFALSGACLLLGGIELPYPSPYADRTSRVRFRLPLEGTWTVRFGAEAPYRQPLRFSPSRRFGYEFWRTRADGAPDPEATVGGAVVAPCAGEVQAVLPVPEDARAAEAGGSEARLLVVLRLEDGTFAFVRGLEAGSVAVAPGARVASGEPLGRVGRPPEPRFLPSLGLHLQDTPVPGDGVGMPLAFGRLVVEGDLREDVVPAGGVKLGVGRKGWRVAPAPEPDDAPAPGR